jgi:hypothetical protein
LAIHRAAVLIFPGLASYSRHPFFPQEKIIQGLRNTVSIRPWCDLIDYANTGDYALGFTITEVRLVNQRRQLLNEFVFNVCGWLAVNLIEGIVIKGLMGKLIKPQYVKGKIERSLGKHTSTGHLFTFVESLRNR